MKHQSIFRICCLASLSLAFCFGPVCPVNGQTVDLTFNNTGWVPYNEAGTNEEIKAVFEQQDGKVIAIAETNYDPDEASNYRIVILRFNHNGTPDISWSPTGKVYIDTPNSTDRANAAIQQPDGKILIAGYQGSFKGTVYRLNTNGTLDNSFGVGGKAVINNESVYQLRNIKLQSDGKIVVSGQGFIDSRFSYLVARFNTNGTLDASFNAPNGYIKFRTSTSSTEEDNGAGYGLDIHKPTGKIVTCGYNEKEYGTAARLLPNGTLDNTLGINGIRVIDFGNDMYLYSVIVQDDEKILLGGTYYYTTSRPVAQILRLFSNGNLDSSWDGTGIGWYGNPAGAGNDMVMQCDGKILIGGGNYLARALANGASDPTFGTSGHYNFNVEYTTSAYKLHVTRNNIYLAGYYRTQANFSDVGGFILRLNNTIDCGSVAAEEPDLELNLQAYPNPVRDLLSLKTGAEAEVLEISLTDQLGRVVISQNEFVQDGSLFQCDMTRLSPGTYYAVVTTAFGRKAIPVIKI